MKNKYYFINNEGKKVLARTSNNDYKYALIYMDKSVFKCSSKKETIENAYKYHTKGYGYKFEDKVNGRYLFSNQFYNPKDFKIVELIKEK